MRSIQQLLAYTEAIELIEKLSSSSGDLPVDSGTAALFLGISESTLARLRQQGSGPPYLQYPETGRKSRNQKINYILRDLRVWRESRVVRSTMEAAVNRGMAMFGDALHVRQPFWTLSRSRSSRLIGHVLNSSREEFQRLIGHASVIWIAIPDALQREWEDSIQKQLFQTALSKACKT